MTGPRFDDPDVRVWVFANPRNLLAWAAHLDLPASRAAKWNATGAIWLGTFCLMAHLGGVSWQALAITAVGTLAVGAGVAIWLMSTAPAKTRQERARIAELVAVDRPGMRVAIAEEHAAYGCQWDYRGDVRVCAFGHSEAVAPAELVGVAA